MTVGKLIDELKNFNPNMELLDDEIYSPASGVQDDGTNKITLNFACWNDKADKKIQGYLLLLSVNGLKK